MIICTVKIRGLDPVGDKPDPDPTVKKKPDADPTVKKKPDPDLTLQKQTGSLNFSI